MGEDRYIMKKDHAPQASLPPKIPCKIKLVNLLFSLVLKIILRSDGSVNRRLIDFLERKSPPSENSLAGVRSSDFTIDSPRNLWIRCFIPDEDDGGGGWRPMIVFFHGGGFVFGCPDFSLCDASCRKLSSKLNAVIFSVKYRLAPEHRFPCQYDDGFDAIRFIDEQFDNYFAGLCDPTRCFLMGESAGGNLAHHMAVRSRNHKFNNLQIVGLIAVQPFFGGEERTESELRFRDGAILTLEITDRFWRAFLPKGESSRDHPAANVVVSSELKLPPTVVFVGGLDLLKDRQVSYCEALEKAGSDVKMVEYPNAIHGFTMFTSMPEYGLFVETVRDFLQKPHSSSWFKLK